MVFLFFLELETVSVLELSQQLFEQVPLKAACDKRLQRQEAALQMSLLFILFAISFGHLQAREASARELQRFHHRHSGNEGILSQILSQEYFLVR